MSKQAITVNFHAYSGGGVRVRHDGPCTWENCGRFMSQIVKMDKPQSVIDHAIDTLDRKDR